MSRTIVLPLSIGQAGLWHKGSIIDAADEKLQSAFEPEEATQVLKPGLLCSLTRWPTQDQPHGNTAMRQVDADQGHPGYRLPIAAADTANVDVALTATAPECGSGGTDATNAENVGQ
jgi:hypothetical protein